MTHVEKRHSRPGKETIHSGHFMVSHFEAEAQDDFDDLAVPVPDEEQNEQNIQKVSVVATYTVPGSVKKFLPNEKDDNKQLSIEISLTKLFRCMTLAYRQKLTSPKWNRFKGIKLRWKDKIRLNNVIWRCWHMQFIKKQNTLVCQFASPLDVDTHVKPETTILEGKYWKRRAEAVIAEYKKWRMFHIMRLFGKGDTSVPDAISDMDTVESFSQCGDMADSMLTDEDYLNFMSDTLFSTITNHQPFAFPDCREIARGASLADFIQPSLGPLQPNLDDFMDTLEPLHDLLLTPRLPPVPEESIPAEDTMYRSVPVQAYSTQYMPEAQPSAMPIHGTTSNQMISDHSVKNEHMRIYDNNRMYNQTDLQNNMINTQELVAYNVPATNYETQDVQNNVYSKQRMYVNPPKIMPAPEPYKYNAAIPPSQTAPETVSLLQQPIQNQKYTSTIVLQSRPGFRDKQRSRVTHYTNQLPNNHYQNYNQQMPQTSQQTNYDARQLPVRQSSPQMQYLQPNQEYKKATVSRSFKMPSPPLSVSSQQVQPAPSNQPALNKEQFRSHSLPLGASLNADWSVTTQPQESLRRTNRPREATPQASRVRSRSSSGAGEGSSGSGRPPLSSVASEPALPHASLMLAQLLSQQHSQSLYKLNSNTSEEGNDPKSPIKKGQPSPIGSDVMSPHQSLSPPCSPGSPRAGSPRRSHLHAEQKRRYNIKHGFDTLHALLPPLPQCAAAKISKAAMLQKGAEYIKQLKAERNQIKEEMESLRQQIECLNNSISNCHSLLPATGAPVSRARAGRLREMFARHVATRTIHNWKYWLFSVVSAALVESFSSCVSCGSGADLVRTTLLWAEQHCSLVEMRPAVLNSLRVLCTTTDILTNPERLPDEARAAAASSASVKTEPS